MSQDVPINTLNKAERRGSKMASGKTWGGTACSCAKYDYDEAKKEDPTRKYTTLKYMHINNVLKLYEIDMVTPIKMYLCLECVFEGCFIDSIIDRSLIPTDKYNDKWNETVENGCKYGSCCSPY